MDEIVKELREDKKRAWDMIANLNERLLIAEKRGKDEELHQKMDKIFGKLEEQRGLAMKVDYLTDELEKSQGYISHFVESHEQLKEKMESLSGMFPLKNGTDGNNSPEMKEILDTVQTTEGYMELFTKEFEKIHAKMNEISGSIRTVEVLNRKTDQIETKIDSLAQTLSAIQKEVDGNKEMVQKNLMKIQEGNQKIEKLTDMNEQWNEIEKALESQKLEFEKLKSIRAGSVEKSNKNTEPKTEATYRCFNSNCNFLFPKEVQLEEDGVTVYCPNKECGINNIVGKLKPGYKWMGMMCNGKWHRQQYPIGTKDHGQGICQVCGKRNILTDSNSLASISNENKGVTENLSQRSQKMFSLEPRLECYNSNCKQFLPNRFQLREDGVTVSCKTCRVVNIVGKLRDGQRWMRMCDDWHYQQFHISKQPGDRAICQVCGKSGNTLGKNDLTAIPVF